MIHVPKAAGTSMAGLLFGRSLGHFTLSEYHLYLGPTRRFSPPLFAVIREPEDRFLSAYRFFRQGRTRDAGVQLSHQRADLWKQDVELFLEEYVEATPDRARDYIFQTQDRFVTLSPVDTPELTLFRLDALETLQDWLSERLHQPVVFPYKNRSDLTHSVALSPSQRQRIRKIYCSDFALYDKLQAHPHYAQGD